MRITNVVVGEQEELFPVWAFYLKSSDRAEAKVIVVDRPTKRIVCLPVSHGCARKCIFCSSSVRPLIRMFSLGEMMKITELVTNHTSLPKRLEPTLVSLMGVGDPLDNDCVPEFLQEISGEFRTALATTVPSLESLHILATKNSNTKITVSLHAGTHSSRMAIMNSVECIAPRELYDNLGNSVEYNYVVVNGINDSEDEAIALNRAVGNGLMRLKLNTLNTWPGIPCKEGEFPIYMLSDGIEVEKYSTDGSSLFGACGQCGYINNKGRTNDRNHQFQKS